MSQINFSQTVQQKIESIKTQFQNFLETFELKTDSNQRGTRIYREQAIQMKEMQRNTLFIDFAHLLNFSQDDNEISETILSDFYRIEPHLRKVVANFVFSVTNTASESDNYFLSFYNLTFTKKIREMRTSEIGKLNCIKGLVTRSTEVRPELLYGCFNCSLCNTEVREVEQQFKFTEPKVCSNPGCHNHSKWSLKTNNSVFTDFQKLRVQEESSEIPAGGMPRSIDVVVRNEIVDKAKPGDKCIFTGYLVVVPDITALTKPGEKTEMSVKNEGIRVRNEGTNDGMTGLSQLGQRDLNYKLVFLANNVEATQNRFDLWTTEEDPENITEEMEQERIRAEYSQAHLEELKAMKDSQDIYERLASSIAPTVHGHLEVKKGILLMLFSGVNKKTEEGINLRGDLNICMVGDPSTAKSQFLKYVNKLIPRSVYTSGKASTSAGLTASVTRDPETGENCIEAGALMLSDQGICCIDEFDKMDKKDQVAIHEAMEQQTISIAKAGIQATLNARASILAAANPLFGRYDKSKSLKYNLDISAPIMSRFDLFYVILDECNEVADKNIASHIVALHQQSGRNIKPEFTTEQLSRYIRFGRTIKPQFSREAALELQKSYVKLRQNDISSQKTSYRITVRQLESLIRLSEGLARVYLSPVIEPSFVKEAQRLLSNSILKIEKGQYDYFEEEEGQKISQSDKQNAQNIIQEELEAKQKEELRQQNKVKMTYDEYSNIKKAIITAIQERESEEQAIAEAAGNNMEVERQYGFLQKDIVEAVLSRMIENDLISTEEEALKMSKIYNSIIKKLIETEHILIVVEDNSAFSLRRLALHANYVEDN